MMEMLPGIPESSLANAAMLAERMKSKLENLHISIEVQSVRVTASFGHGRKLIFSHKTLERIIIMKLLPFILSICLITHSLAYGAESFSFSGIQWTDTRDVISKKLKETTEFEGLRNNGIAYNQIMGEFPRDFIKNNKLSNINNELLKCGHESIVRVMADVDISNVDGIICRSCRGGLFYFSAFDEKLLYYEIDIKLEMKDSVLQSLQKKYGQGRDFGEEKSNLLMWETDNELLFISKKSGQLLYINTNNLMDLIEPCMKAKKVDTEKNNAKAIKLF